MGMRINRIRARENTTEVQILKQYSRLPDEMHKYGDISISYNRQVPPAGN